MGEEGKGFKGGKRIVKCSNPRKGVTENKKGIQMKGRHTHTHQRNRGVREERKTKEGKKVKEKNTKQRKEGK